MSWYKTGTATVTNGSPNITLVGADLITNKVQVGWAFVGPDGRNYEIASIQSATQLTLATNYASSTGAGYVYSIAPTSSLAGDLATAVNNLVVNYQAIALTYGQGMFPDGTAAAPGFRFTADQDTGFYRPEANAIGVSVGGTEVVRARVNGIYIAPTIGSSIGFSYTERFTPSGTTNSVAQYGWTFNPFGQYDLVQSAFGPQRFFVGSALRWTIDTNGFYPGTDNGETIGTASYRVSVVYAASGSINTSDERLKNWRGSLTDAELAAAAEIGPNIGVYQMKDAVVRKGADGARLHVGVGAQTVWGVMAKHGLVEPMTTQQSTSRYAFLGYDKLPAEPSQPPVDAQPARLDDDGVTVLRPAIPAQEARAAKPARDIYGVRYDELAMFLLGAAAVREAALQATVTSQGNRLLAIEARLPA